MGTSSPMAANGPQPVLPLFIAVRVSSCSGVRRIFSFARLDGASMAEKRNGLPSGLRKSSDLRRVVKAIAS
ncbi:hypothetical protein D3C72_2306650 [compost metagenome]